MFDYPPDHEDTMATFGCMGVTRFVALTYAHRPGPAADLKAWVPEMAETTAGAIPFTTVHAADKDVGGIVERAITNGACGLTFQLPI